MLNLSSGRSEKDRISFYSSSNGATAIRNTNESISIEFGKTNIHLKATIMLLGIFCTLSIIKTYVIISLIEYKTIGLIWYLISTFIYFFFISFFCYICKEKKWC